MSGFFDTRQPVTVHRPTKTTDAYGYEQYGEPYTDEPADFYYVIPRRTQEYTQGRQTLTTQMVAYAPPDTRVDERCELSSLGKRYRVTGIYPIPDMDDPSETMCLKLELEGAG